MSIIADTLQRLQKHDGDHTPEGGEKTCLIMADSRKQSAGRLTRIFPLKRHPAGIAMFIVWSVLGLAFSWIGMHWEFNMPTYASPGGRQGRSAFTSSRTLQDQSSSEHLFPQTIAHSFLEPPIAVTPASSLGTAPFSLSDFLQPPKLLQLKIPAARNTRASSAIKQRSEEGIASSERADASLPPSDIPDIPIEGLLKNRHRMETAMHHRVAWKKGKNRSAGETPGIELPSRHPATSGTASTAEIPGHPSHRQTAQASMPIQRVSADRLGQAQQLIQAGKYKEAEAFLAPLFENLPEQWEPWFWMGTALLGQHLLEQADGFFLNGLARNDTIPQLWIQRALVAHQLGKYQLAIHELQRAESLEAGLPHTYLNMGYAYEKLGNERLANDYYGKFLQVSADNPAFFSTRKKIYVHFTEQIHSISHSTHPPSLPEHP